MRKTVEIDEFDRRLIEQVRHNNIEPARTLADKVGLSPSAVLRRLRRLRKEKVIIADIAVIDPQLTGTALTIHVVVKMQHSGMQLTDTFSKRIVRHREVTGAWNVTGDYDFLLKVQVGTMEEYDAFTHRALSEEQGVLNFQTSITIRTIADDVFNRRPLV